MGRGEREIKVDSAVSIAASGVVMSIDEPRGVRFPGGGGSSGLLTGLGPTGTGPEGGRCAPSRNLADEHTRTRRVRFGVCVRSGLSNATGGRLMRHNQTATNSNKREHLAPRTTPEKRLANESAKRYCAPLLKACISFGICISR